MAKSRNRGGAKAHRKRVQKRNQRIGIQQKAFQKSFSAMYESKMKELQEKFESLTASTENNEEPIGENQTIEVADTKTEDSQSN